MSEPLSPGDKIRRYARQNALSQQDLDYLLGVVGEAVLAERERCRCVAWAWGARHNILSWSGREVAEHIARDIAGES